MACTTLLVGKNASYDGSTMIARNDDSGSGHFTAKKFVVVQPEEHPAVYRSVLSHVEIPLPGDPMRMTAMPNAVEGKGIWAAAGVNAALFRRTWHPPLHLHGQILHYRNHLQLRADGNWESASGTHMLQFRLLRFLQRPEA